MLEIFLGFCSIRFHIVCSYTSSCSYNLTDEWTIDRVTRESFYEFNNCFTELCSSFFKIVLLLIIWILTLIWYLSFVICHCLVSERQRKLRHYTTKAFRCPRKFDF